jgi:hypothetical protein
MSVYETLAGGPDHVLVPAVEMIGCPAGGNFLAVETVKTICTKNETFWCG